MEISQALRDCHAAKTSTKAELSCPKGHVDVLLAAKTAGDSDG
jgi:hypothetical protein